MDISIEEELTFSSMINHLGKVFNNIPDWRQKNKTDYSIYDNLMSGFACMYMQNSSLLDFQLKLKEERQISNLETMFKVTNIPKNNQLKNVLNHVEHKYLRSVKRDLMYKLRKTKQLQKYELFDGKYLVDIDGVQYYESENINCECCLTKEHKGTIHYSHQAVQTVICHPSKREVFPLYAEEIQNNDGQEKQDCETNAVKRLLVSLKEMYPDFSFIINGDDIYSREPIVALVKENGWNYIFVVKPKTHEYMMSYIEKNQKELFHKKFIDKKGRSYHYSWMLEVPLNGKKDMLFANYFSLTITETKNGTEVVTYSNSWITDLEINNENIELIVKAARARWKIENECFNNLKNRGYHLEHNFGHGKLLAFNMYLLMLLAFFMHQILEIASDLYIKARERTHTKKTLWDKIRVLINTFPFENWDDVLKVILNPNAFKLVPV